MVLLTNIDAEQGIKRRIGYAEAAHVQAKLIKNLSYTTLEGIKIRVKKNTQILVDVKKKIAFIKNDCVHIEDDEYCVIFMN